MAFGVTGAFPLAMLASLSAECLIPVDHPIRRIRVVFDEALAGTGSEFDGMYAVSGWRSVPPEQLLKASVLMAMYSMRSEWAFCERLNYHMLFKWFLGMAIDARASDATTFTKNRVRLLEHSTTDPDALLFRKGNNAAELSYMGHLLIENRSGLIVDADITKATGCAERDCATEILERLPTKKRRRTIAADKGYDTKGFVTDVSGLGFAPHAARRTPHVAQNNKNRRSAIDGRTTRYAGHSVSQ